MINLIRNELKKIFHKKAIYVILVIAVGFMILNIVLTKYFENNIVFDNRESDVEYYSDVLNELDKNDPNYKEIYKNIKSQLETAKLLQKYDTNSWQWQVITSNSEKYVYPMVEAEGTEKYEQAKKEYDDFVKKLDSGDWKTFVQAELNELNEQIKAIEAQDDLAIKISKEIGTPIVLDYHHHNCNKCDFNIEDVIDSCGERIPKMHFSSPKNKKDYRSHSEYVSSDEFISFIDILKKYDRSVDIMIEAKAEDDALFRLVRELKYKTGYKFIDDTSVEV